MEIFRFEVSKTDGEINSNNFKKNYISGGSKGFTWKTNYFVFGALSKVKFSIMTSLLTVCLRERLSTFKIRFKTEKACHELIIKTKL